jgi:hypothetical protein
MELLGDMRLMEPHFGPFGDHVTIGERKDHGLRPMYHKLGNHFGRGSSASSFRSIWR